MLNIVIPILMWIVWFISPTLYKVLKPAMRKKQQELAKELEEWGKSL